MLISGKEKLERMRDGRAVYIGAERVDDVTAHPAFRTPRRPSPASTTSRPIPSKRDLFSFEENGERYGLLLAALPQPRRSGAPHARDARRSPTRPTVLIGRSPDQVSRA